MKRKEVKGCEVVMKEKRRENQMGKMNGEEMLKKKSKV